MDSTRSGWSQSAAILAAMGCLVLVMIGCLWMQAHTTVSAAPAAGGQEHLSSLTLAAYQAWFGLDSHIQPPPYLSTDPAVIDRHLAAARARGIDAFVVDWYGPQAGLANDVDRGLIDEATALLVERAVGSGVQVALMYDEGALRWAGIPPDEYQAQAIADLLYARRYLTQTSYLLIDGQPALFVFPYDDVDPWLDWAEIRQALGVTVTLFDKDPDEAHAAAFDGFYAWVYPGSDGWSEDCSDWGQDYLEWFYWAMNAQFPDKLAVGAVWPGFDDTDAHWGLGRCMAPRCGQTWRDTWRLARMHAPPAVLIVTWNDREEGTAVEFGTGECLLPPRAGIALPGGREVYTHTLVNTAKFTDTLSLSFHSPAAWPVSVNPPGATLGRLEAMVVTVTVTIPAEAVPTLSDTLQLTATSALSPAVSSRLVDTTTVGYGRYLPLVLTRRQPNRR